MSRTDIGDENECEGLAERQEYVDGLSRNRKKVNVAAVYTVRE